MKTAFLGIKNAPLHTIHVTNDLYYHCATNQYSPKQCQNTDRYPGGANLGKVLIVHF